MRNSEFFNSCPAHRYFKNIILIISTLYCASLPAQVMAKDRFKLQFLPKDGQISEWQDGTQSLDDIGHQSIVRLTNSHDQLPDKQTTFRIYFLNISDEPINLGPENIWIEYGNGERVAIATHDDLIGRFRRDLKRRRALAAFAGAMSASSANGYSSGTFSYMGSTNYGTQFSGVGTYTAYNPALARQQRDQAIAQTNATFNSIQVRQLEGISALNGLLRTTSVKPGQVHGSIVAFDPPRSFKKLSSSSTIFVVVKVGETEHRIEATISRLRNE